MANKYLEKIAGISGAAALGAIAGYRNSKKDDKVGGTVAGAAAGGATGNIANHLLETPMKKMQGRLAHIDMMPRGRRLGYAAGAAASAIGLGAAALGANYVSGKAAGKVYGKAKDIAKDRK